MQVGEVLRGHHLTGDPHVIDVPPFTLQHRVRGKLELDLNLIPDEVGEVQHDWGKPAWRIRQVPNLEIVGQPHRRAASQDVHVGLAQGRRDLGERSGLVLERDHEFALDGRSRGGRVDTRTPQRRPRCLDLCSFPCIIFGSTSASWRISAAPSALGGFMTLCTATRGACWGHPGTSHHRAHSRRLLASHREPTQ